MVRKTGFNHRIYRHSNPSCARDGFTLLETMFAVSIIAIVLVSIYQLHTRTISMNIDAKFYTVAPFLAQKKLAELELSPLKEATDNSGDFGDDFPGYTYKIEIADIETDLIGSVSKDLKKIDITISLNDDEFNYGFSTYRLDRR